MKVLPLCADLYESWLKNSDQEASAMCFDRCPNLIMLLTFKSSTAIKSNSLTTRLDDLCRKSLRTFATFSCNFESSALARSLELEPFFLRAKLRLLIRSCLSYFNV